MTLSCYGLIKTIKKFENANTELVNNLKLSEEQMQNILKRQNNRINSILFNLDCLTSKYKKFEQFNNSYEEYIKEKRLMTEALQKFEKEHK
jgi:DNA gyrase/topoisomerase IV subunit A